MINIVCIGDSITAGHPLFDPDPSFYAGTDPKESCYEYHLAKRLNNNVGPIQETFQTSDGHTWTRFVGSNYTVVNVGIGSTSTGNWVSRFTANVVELSPQFAIFFGNANDPVSGAIGGGQTEQQSKDNYISMINTCIANNIIPIVGTNTPRSSTWASNNTTYMTRYDSFDAWLRTYATMNSINLIDFHDMLDDTNGYLQTTYNADGIHLSTTGYTAMGNGIDLSLFSVTLEEKTKTYTKGSFPNYLKVGYSQLGHKQSIVEKYSIIKPNLGVFGTGEVKTLPLTIINKGNVPITFILGESTGTNLYSVDNNNFYAETNVTVAVGETKTIYWKVTAPINQLNSQSKQIKVKPINVRERG